MSAGTIEPSSKYIISPGTNRFAEIVLSSPSLRTLAVGALILRSASKALEAFFSSIIPIIALRQTIINITIASVHSFKKIDNIEAPIRIRTIVSDNCSQSIFKIVFSGDLFNWLKPYFLSNSSALASLSPSSELSKSLNVSSMDFECQGLFLQFFIKITPY